MSETFLVFILGVPLATFLVTLQIWASFKSTDKHKEANFTLLLGGLISFLILLLIAYFLGWLTRPAQVIVDVLNIQIGIGALILWTTLLLLLPRVAKAIVRRITTSGVEPVKPITNGSLKKKENSKNVKSKFRDLLKTSLDKWHTVSGFPQISTIRGNPNPPSLLLEEYPSDSRNSFVLAKNLKIKSGKISCDIYMEREAVFNLVFSANSNASEFYMARVDSRNAGSNGFLITRNSRSWTYIKQPNTFVLNDQWHHVELNLAESKFELTIDNEEPIVVEDTSFNIEGQVGMFNELKRVFVNKFTIE